MHITVIGAGWTGLTAAYRLLQQGHTVTVIEKDSQIGGLASTFREPSWNWPLEKFYHHWFANDYSALGLARELGVGVVLKKPETEILYSGRTYPFDTPRAILTFPHFTFLDKFRLSISMVYLKFINNYHVFDSVRAYEWVKKWTGSTVTRIVWEPLLRGKFGDDYTSVAMTWFWARVKKRTSKLAYPDGGFAHLANKLKDKILSVGGSLLLSTTITKVSRIKKGFNVYATNGTKISCDAIIITGPTHILPRLFPKLPTSYIKRILSIRHEWAQVLILRLKKPLMKKTYWLNMTDARSPFLVACEHTNFADKKNYNNEHIVYIGNYLPDSHPYLKKTSSELMRLFDSQLKKLNSQYRKNLIATHLFTVPGAQPIVDTSYEKRLPSMTTPIPGVYIANMDMVFPWDRGTNYAIDMGERVAKAVTQRRLKRI